MSGVDYFVSNSSYPRSPSDQSSISHHHHSVSNSSAEMLTSNNPYREHMGTSYQSKKCMPSRATAAVFSSGYEFQDSRLKRAPTRASSAELNSGYMNSDIYQGRVSMKYGPQAYAPAPCYRVEHVPEYDYGSRLSTLHLRGQTETRHQKHIRFPKGSRIINPDKTDRMDGSTDIAYHHENSYDAVYAERNYDKKSSPLEAVKESNAMALAATPYEKIVDSLQSGRPLDCVAHYAPGQTDRNGRTYDYEEGDNMMNDMGNYMTVPRYTDEDFANDEFTNMRLRSPYCLLKKLFSRRRIKRAFKALTK